jgi:mannose-6-phosphate isomerase-like protein (cupin superfamily)
MPMSAIFNSYQIARYDELPLTNVPMLQEEGLRACLLGFLPGQHLPRHAHEHEHEIFDVLEGRGMIWLDGESVEAGPGASVFVPANVEHGIENTGSERWLIRATIYERTYLRQALARSALKRIGKADW